MISSRLAVALLLHLSWLLKVVAFPSQAGHCEAGPIDAQNVTNGHATYPDSPDGGTITNGGYHITVDGVALDDLNTNTLVAGTDYTVRIESIDSINPSLFRGFLVRLNGDSTTKDAFTPVGGNIQLHPVCVVNEVAAVTHNLNDDKTMVEFTLNLPENIPAIDLDVTVLRVKAFGNWYYSRYTLSTSSDPVNSPTIPPATGPTELPTLPVPTEMPTPETQPTGMLYSCGGVNDNALVEVSGGKLCTKIFAKRVSWHYRK